MTGEPVTLSLTRAEAIVLAEFLLRFSNEDRLAVEHDAEARVLWDLAAALESRLSEVLDPQWRESVEKARAAIDGGADG